MGLNEEDPGSGGGPGGSRVGREALELSLGGAPGLIGARGLA